MALAPGAMICMWRLPALALTSVMLPPNPSPSGWGQCQEGLSAWWLCGGPRMCTVLGVWWNGSLMLCCAIFVDIQWSVKFWMGVHEEEDGVVWVCPPSFEYIKWALAATPLQQTWMGVVGYLVAHGCPLCGLGDHWCSSTQCTYYLNQLIFNHSDHSS